MILDHFSTYTSARSRTGASKGVQGWEVSAKRSSATSQTLPTGRQASSATSVAHNILRSQAHPSLIYAPARICILHMNFISRLIDALGVLITRVACLRRFHRLLSLRTCNTPRSRDLMFLRRPMDFAFPGAFLT